MTTTELLFICRVSKKYIWIDLQESLYLKINNLYSRNVNVEKKVELTTVFDAINLAKYKVYVSKYLSSSNFKWTITFSDSTTAEVKPLADGTTELDLDALASDGATVHSKLLANAKVKIVATSPSQPYPQPTNIAIFNATFKNLPAITPAE